METKQIRADEIKGYAAHASGRAIPKPAEMQAGEVDKIVPDMTPGLPDAVCGTRHLMTDHDYGAGRSEANKPG